MRSWILNINVLFPAVGQGHNIHLHSCSLRVVGYVDGVVRDVCCWPLITFKDPCGDQGVNFFKGLNGPICMFQRESTKYTTVSQTQDCSFSFHCLHSFVYGPSSWVLHMMLPFFFVDAFGDSTPKRAYVSNKEEIRILLYPASRTILENPCLAPSLPFLFIFSAHSLIAGGQVVVMLASLGALCTVFPSLKLFLFGLTSAACGSYAMTFVKCCAQIMGSEDRCWTSK